MTFRKRFTTIVPHAENLELRKDPGQIPYHFYSGLGYDATLVTYFYALSGGRNAGPWKAAPIDQDTVGANYPNLQNEVPGLKMTFLDNLGRARFYDKAIYRYLLSHARQIDILNLFHFNTENIFYTLVYKLLNPRGKVYIKLDIDLHYYRSRAHFFNTVSRFSRLKAAVIERIAFRFFFAVTKVISAESKAGLSYFQARFPAAAAKLRLVKNGVDADKITRHVHVRTFAEKDNLLLTTGRIGSAQKNSRLLLRAIAALPPNDWTFCFVGDMQPDFLTEIEAFYTARPDLKDKIMFTGRIDDPAILYEYYNRAKIFCLSSLNEGFPLAACEAAFFGNYLVLADTIDCFPELTDSGRLGTAVSLEEKKWTNTIADLMADPDRLEAASAAMRDYARRELCWQAIIPALASEIEN